MINTSGNEGTPAPTNEVNTNEYGVDHSFSKAQLSKYGRENLIDLHDEIKSADLDGEGDFEVGEGTFSGEGASRITLFDAGIEIDFDFTVEDGDPDELTNSIIVPEYFDITYNDDSIWGDDMDEILGELVTSALENKSISTKSMWFCSNFN